MIQVKSVKYGAESENELNFSIGGKGIHGIFCDNDEEIALLTDLLSGCKDTLFGSILIGKDEAEFCPSEQRARVGVALSKMPFYEDMTVEETLEFVALSKKTESEKSRRQIKEALSLLGIENIAKKQIKKLSPQSRRRLSTAQALLGNPDIIIFESPTSEVDENCASDMRELIKMLGNMKSVVVLSSDDDLLIDLCEDIKVISGGKLLFDGSSEELASHIEGGRIIKVTLKGSAENIEEAADKVKALYGAELVEIEENAVTVCFDSKNVTREAILSVFEESNCIVRSVKISARAVADTFCETSEEDKKEEE